MLFYSVCGSHIGICDYLLTDGLNPIDLVMQNEKPCDELFYSAVEFVHIQKLRCGYKIDVKYDDTKCNSIVMHMDIGSKRILSLLDFFNFGTFIECQLICSLNCYRI